MVVTLNARSIARLKPKPVAYYISDAVIRGLQIRVSERGDKAWSVRYRLHGRRWRYGLGDATAVSLAKARKAAKDALTLVHSVPPQNPAQQKREERTADTIATLAALYLDKHAKPKKRSWKGDERILDTIILPAWKHRPAKTITRRDVRELVESVNGSTYPNRVRALLFTLFNFALERDIVDANPVAGTKRPGRERSRDRVLTEPELRAFWAATETMEPVMAAVFRLRLLTAQRGGEVINLRWQDLDLVNALWTIPSQYAKNKLPHRVPLNAAALDLLKDLRTAVEARLAKAKHPKEPIFVLRGARGNRQRGVAAKDVALENFRGHDLRRTAATLMASSGASETVIAKILNHQDRGVTKIYVRSGYDIEKRIALEAWGRQLLAIVEPKDQDGGAVLPFARS